MYMILSKCSGGNNLPYNGKYVYATMQLLGLKKNTLYEECVYATKQLLGRKQTNIYGKCICFNATAGAETNYHIWVICIFCNVTAGKEKRNIYGGIFSVLDIFVPYQEIP